MFHVTIVRIFSLVAITHNYLNLTVIAGLYTKIVLKEQPATGKERYGFA